MKRKPNSTPRPQLPPDQSPYGELIDLHIHVGGAVAPHILWSMAHQQGIKLPFKTYWQFRKAITVDPKKVKNLNDYLGIFHKWTENIQSSPAAIERSVYEIISKEYRASNVTAIELRFNPMKRNVEGEKDLDHIIHAALRGMDQACLEYGTKSCLIFCLAREFSFEQNEIIVRKAIKYRTRGVTAIDIAGPESKSLELQSASARSYAKLFAQARDAGLRTTVHTGETLATGGEGIMAVLKYLKPDRIGHGIWAAKHPQALEAVLKANVHLELNPSSNISTHAVKDLAEFGQIVRVFLKNGVRFSINTDGPYILNTHLRQEFDLLVDAKILSLEQAKKCLKTARQDSFITDL